jgi:hypothetical protein
MRDILDCNGMEQWQIDNALDEPVEYIKALIDVELINSNKDVMPIEDPLEDHQAYLSVYQQANENKYKQNAVIKRIQAQVEKEKTIREQKQIQNQNETK